MKILKGIVISTKMQKTAVIAITRKTPHPFYKKLMKKTKNYKADTSDISVQVGDMVQMSKIAPISKDKHFKITKILKKAEPVVLEQKEK